MNIAYLILAHKSPGQLNRLLDRLNCENTFFFIHIDKNASDEVFFEVYNRARGSNNVFFVNRIGSVWADFSLVQATLEGIRAVMDSGVNPDYVFLISGQDYPIKTNHFIKAFLERGGGSCFIHSFPIPRPGWHNGFFHQIPCRYALPPGISSLYGGSQWWCLTKECIEYIDRFIAENPGYVEYCRQLFVPDEIFFQTIVLNSPFAGAAVNDGLRYIDWDSAPPPKNHPATLDRTYYPVLSSSPCLFARKLDVDFDPELFDMIDRNLL